MREKKEMLLSYVKANIAPILVDFIFGQDLEDSIVLPANIDIKELNGYYDDINFMPPKWLNQILNTNTSKLLVIDKIDSIPKEEQLKFCELLKYRKISTFELPKNCLVIVTCSDLTANKINEEVYSLLAQI